MHSKYSKKTVEVDTVVSKPLINPGAGQVYSECGGRHMYLLTVMICLAFLLVDSPFSTCGRCDFEVDMFKACILTDFDIMICSTIVERDAFELIAKQGVSRPHTSGSAGKARLTL